MDYDKLKNEINEITAIASGVPEQFQVSCFEILLQNLLRGVPGEEVQSDQAKPPSIDTIPRPAQVRVLMRKTGTTLDELSSVLLYADGEIHFLKEPTTGKIAEGQMDWALLVALKNGILSNDLAADPEDVRSICQEKGFYDAGNFASTFKQVKNAKLFKKPLEPQGKPQQLSGDGQIALGRLIKALAEG